MASRAATKAGEQVAEGIIAKAVKKFLRVSAKDATKDVGKALTKDAAKTAAKDGAKAGRRSLRDALKDLRGKAKDFLSRNKCGDPIDVVSGEVVLQQTDVELPGVLPLTLERAHVSSYREGRLFGHSWASTLDQRLEFDGVGVCFAAEDGRILAYPPPTPNAAVLPEVGPRWPLTMTAGGGYTITDPRSGRTLHFPLPGETHPATLPLVAIGDRTGNRIDMEYAADGTLAEIRHSGGYRILVDSVGGRVTSLRLRGGDANEADITLVRYGYDSTGNLAELIKSSGLPTRFEYDAAGRLTRWIDTNGQWYAYTYDERGRCVAGGGSEGFLAATLAYHDRTTVVADSLGHETTYHFNDLGQVTAVVDPLGHTTRSEWDRHDRLLTLVDPLDRITRRTYDDAGNTTAVTRPDGAQVTAVYDDLRQPVAVTEADGAVWRNTYDEHGNVISVTDPANATTRYSYDAHGGLVQIIDALGARTRIENNPAGLPVRVIGQLGAVTTYERDAFGRVSSITDATGGVTRFGWTIEGRPSWRSLPDGSVERWKHDGEGNLIERTDAAGHTTRFLIGHCDLVIAETGPDGARLEYAYDTELRLTAVTNPLGLVWRYEYDPAGNLIKETDFNDRVIRYGHDVAGQLIERVNGTGDVIRYSRNSLGDVTERHADGTVATFSYDPARRLVRAVNDDADLQFDRDRLGRVVTEACNGRALSSAYDALGRRIRRRTPSGAESTWVYDAAGRPTALHTGGQVVQFSHDAVGREVERAIAARVALTRTWDSGDRLASQSLWSTAAPRAAEQDATGRPAARPARLLRHRAYRYRADGQLIGVHEQMSGTRLLDLDAAGRVTAVRGENWTESYAYDAAGNLIRATWPAPQRAATEAMDARGEREYGGTLIQRAGGVHYEHDAQGRVVLRYSRRENSRPVIWRYRWNADDRLTDVHTPDGQHWRYRYDAIGRRIAKQRLGPDGNGIIEHFDFAWDGSELAEQVHFTWSAADRRYIGRGTVWDYESDGPCPLVQTERVPAKDATQQWVDERFYAIVTDLVGNPTELVDPTGRIAWSPVTTLWDARLFTPETPEQCPLRFPGQYFDSETGLSYNYHRYYDPTTARYQTPDPLGIDPGPNNYAYVPNPLGWLDPTGLTPCSRSMARKLASNMRNMQYEKPGSWFAPHHIVAWDDPRADPARQVLDRFNIDINHAENGVWLPQNTKNPIGGGGEAAYHSKVHTDAYYKAVNEALSGATSRSEALQTLGVIRDTLLYHGIFPDP